MTALGLTRTTASRLLSRHFHADVPPAIRDGKIIICRAKCGPAVMFRGGVLNPVNRQQWRIAYWAARSATR